MDSKREQTINSIYQLSKYYGQFNYYCMEISYNYDLKNIINYITNEAKTQELNDVVVSNAIWQEVLSEVNIPIDFGSFGCTAFKMKEVKENETIYRMGRSYDFAKDTSCMLVYCHPEDKLKSVAYAALDNIQANNPIDHEQKKCCLASPFICLDGMNECGVSIAVLTLDSQPTYQKEFDKSYITPTLAIRAVLDNAHSAKEAVNIIHKYNMYATGGRDYHFFITDNTGDTHVVEYDCDSDAIDNFVDLNKVTSYDHLYNLEAVTNFHIQYFDKVTMTKDNGPYGHGRDRYSKVMDIIKRNNHNCSSRETWDALKAVAQIPSTDGEITSNTQWSIIFNNTLLMSTLALRRDFTTLFCFDLKTETNYVPGAILPDTDI